LKQLQQTSKAPPAKARPTSAANKIYEVKCEQHAEDEDEAGVAGVVDATEERASKVPRIIAPAAATDAGETAPVAGSQEADCNTSKYKHNNTT
jgi:hypothetical protein